MAAKVEIFDELDAVARDAAGALDRAAQPSIYHRLDWFRLTLEHCRPPGRLKVLRARSESKADAWLFAMVDGGKAEPLASWYSLRAGVVQTGRDDGGALAGLARSLKQDLRLNSVSLGPINGSAHNTADHFRSAGWLVHVDPMSTYWRINTKGMDFAAYWQSRPGRLRNTAKRKAKAAALEIAIYRAFDAAAWAAYEAVYEASWKPEEGSPAFMRALAEQEGAAGTLRLGIARKEGRPVAAQFWIVENGEATIHKLAYVEDAKQLSPGTILSVEMFREALDVDKVRLIDFGMGDDAYKAEWMEESAPLYRLTAYNPATINGLAGAMRAAASKLVRRRKRG